MSEIVPGTLTVHVIQDNVDLHAIGVPRFVEDTASLVSWTITGSHPFVMGDQASEEYKEGCHVVQRLLPVGAEVKVLIEGLLLTVQKGVEKA